LVQKSVRFGLAKSAKSNSKFISQLTVAILTLASGIIDKLSLLAKNTFLLAQVEHSFWTVETSLGKVHSKRRFFWTGCQIEIGCDFEQIHFVLILRRAAIKPVLHIKV
jgi:hypothetical protein